VLSFLPKNLFYQFSKMTNMYFLTMTVLDWQINKRLPMMVFPLGFVIIVSMIKDIFEDFKRHQSDKKENRKKVLAGDWKTGQFKEKLWKDITVGSIVKIHRDEYFPADLILLNSSAPKGLCYIETKDLDGETNLKHKQGEKKMLEVGLGSD
jgi:P-type E1-E2 ATPase